MDSPEQTAAVPMPENTPMEEVVVDEGVKGDKLNIFVDVYFGFVGYLVELYLSFAESLGLGEPALEEDYKRVRWTCVCSCHLYDDFEELSPGAVQVLQRHLDNSDPQLDRPIRSTEPSGPHDSNLDPTPDRFGRAEHPEIDSVRKWQTKSIYDEFRNRDLNILIRKQTGAGTLWLLPFVRSVGDRWEGFLTSAFDVYDRKHSPDTELFIHIKKRYFKAKGRFSRFLSPKRVKSIKAYFFPNPVNTWPMIGPNYLMHLWQNPHHTDWLTHQKNKSVLDTARSVMRKLSDLVRTDNNCAVGLSGNVDDTLAGQSRQSETQQHLFRRSYVFHTTPKELGIKSNLKFRMDGGFFLVEEFQFPHFLLLVAVILELTVCGLVLGVYFRYVAGLQSLGLYLRLLWTSSWTTGLSMLIIALCLKQLDYPCLEFVRRFWQGDVWRFLETIE